MQRAGKTGSSWRGRIAGANRVTPCTPAFGTASAAPRDFGACHPRGGCSRAWILPAEEGSPSHPRNFCFLLIPKQSKTDDRRASPGLSGKPSPAQLKFVTMGRTGYSKAAQRLHYFCLILALGSFVWGYRHPFDKLCRIHSICAAPFQLTAPHRYNVGVLASVLVHPGFKKALREPDAPRSGLITAIYYLGSWLSYLFLAHPVADKLGRRYAALTGMSVTCVGQALQAGAVGPLAFGMVIVGRIVAGMGIAIISTSVPLYQRYALITPTSRAVSRTSSHYRTSLRLTCCGKSQRGGAAETAREVRCHESRGLCRRPRIRFLVRATTQTQERTRERPVGLFKLTCSPPGLDTP